MLQTFFDFYFGNSDFCSIFAPINRKALGVKNYLWGLMNLSSAFALRI